MKSPREFLCMFKSRSILLILLVVSFAFCLWVFPKTHAASAGLASLPWPFVSADGQLNCSLVVAASAPHGPCGSAHTMEAKGAISIGEKLSLQASGGTLEATMDDYISTYNFAKAQATVKDRSSNLVIVGGPGVNQMTWHYNGLRNGSGARLLPVYFDKADGADCIRVASSGDAFKIEYDQYGKVKTDYGAIILSQDSGRFILFLAGLGGIGTSASCQVMSAYEDWSLDGVAAIIKCSDADGDGLLDDYTIVEKVSGTQNTSASLGSDFGLTALSLLAPMFVATKGKAAKKLFESHITLLIISFMLAMVCSQFLIVAFSTEGSSVFTLGDFSRPFISQSGLLNCSVVVASSSEHGPCSGAHTMDVMGAIVAGTQLGLDATTGTPASELDDTVSTYDKASSTVSFSHLSSDLVVVGGPNVNQVTWYYNNRRNGSGARLLPVYFDKADGADCIRVASSGDTFKIEYDQYGKVKTDYGMIALLHDSDHGVWILILAGLGGSGTVAAARMVASYKNLSLYGSAAIVKFSDSNSDGYLDQTSIVESVGIGKSIGVYSDPACMKPVSSIDWGTVTPGSVKNLTVFVRNEGEQRTFLTLKVSDWNPSEASSYLRVEWNYKGNIIESGQTIAITLTLTIDPTVSNISGFSADFDVSSN